MSQDSVTIEKASVQEHQGTGITFSLSFLCLLAACGSSSSPPPDPCDGPEALADCVSPDLDEDWYVSQSLLYFDTMDSTVEELVFPEYGATVARWEWPPWLKLTAFTKDGIESSDRLLRLYPSTVPERDCRFFDQNPFGRCHVVFYYEAYPGRPCPIYEEFTFDRQGQTTWIEAWSDQPGLTPTTDADPWAEADDTPRLSGRIPGLGTESGQIDLHGEPMMEAAKSDPDVADFAQRADDWFDAWLAEYKAAGEDYWPNGCGW